MWTNELCLLFLGAFCYLISNQRREKKNERRLAVTHILEFVVRSHKISWLTIWKFDIEVPKTYTRYSPDNMGDSLTFASFLSVCACVYKTTFTLLILLCDEMFAIKPRWYCVCWMDSSNEIDRYIDNKQATKRTSESQVKTMR